MKTVKFYGASDDLVEVEGIAGADEFSHYDPYNEMDLDIHGKFIIAEMIDSKAAPRICVYAIYDGCWHFSVGQCDEDTPLPDWPIRISNYESGYSVMLEIDVPDSALMYVRRPRLPKGR